MNKKSLYFTGPQEIEIKTSKVPEPGKNDILVETKYSSISAGTELLFYNNELEKEIELDKEIGSLSNDFDYPFEYGYSVVGKVIDKGKEVSEKWLGQRVFSFNPHESHFLAEPSDLIKLPEEISYEEAVFLPSTETALNLLLDASPLFNEKVAVIGQGVIGLLTTSLLKKMPLSKLITIEKIKQRRKISLSLGAEEAKKTSELKEKDYNSFDLVFEVSGNPKALKKAVELTMPEGKIIIGSWYGEKGKIKLGTQFHRKRLKLISSQVSSINPSISGRWSKKRRIKTTLNLLKEIDLKKLITEKISIEDASKAYKKINNQNKETIQIILKYK